MASFDDVGKSNLIHIADARDRRERSVRGDVDLRNLDIDATIHKTLERRLSDSLAKPAEDVTTASLSMVNGVLELMGRDRANDRALTYEALATLIIMTAAARSAAVDLIPEALRRRFEACTACQELNPTYTFQSAYYPGLASETGPTIDSLCNDCRGIYQGLDSYVREVRALSHVNRVSDDAVDAAYTAFGLEDTDDYERMRRAVEAAVRVLKGK